jgi:hypothetical protein
MQVIPRFHMDKFPAGLGSRHLFDPAVNIRVGVGVLEEAIKRRGGLVPGTAAICRLLRSRERLREQGIGGKSTHGEGGPPAHCSGIQRLNSARADSARPS